MQVFTPDHITSFMYRLIGVTTKKAKEIKAKQLYGIEFDREIYALACANMLIHKDGKTNLEQLDTRKENAAKWIRKIKVRLDGELQEKGVTKVLMNPPFERAYGCMTIVKNVLDNVPNGTKWMYWFYR